VDEAYRVVREACAIARAGVPGPVFVEVPANLYMVSEQVGEGYRQVSALSFEVGDTVDAESLSAAVGVLASARRPLLYLGAGAAGAGEMLVELAERLEAPVSTTFQGKGVFPETHPLFLWPGFGDAAPKFVRKVASSCDATLAIGCRFSEVGTGSYGLEPPGPLVHVDLDPGVFDRNYQTEVAVQADASAFVGALLGELGPGEGVELDGDLRDAIRSGHASVWENWLKNVGGPGVTPAHLLKVLQEHLGPDAVYSTDSGNGTFLALECLRLERPGRFLAPVDFSCMGYSVPASMGAKLGNPEAPVVALAGDGAFLMTGLELLTAVRDRIGVLVLVLRDRELAQIAQFQDTALSRKVASELADFDLGALARGLGIEFREMRSDGDVKAVVEDATGLAASGHPVLVEVEIDYAEKTFFTRGVVKTNLLRLSFRDQARVVGRALKRKLGR
jgi:acetolactate synthase-1/2/3 large subunit